MFFKFEYQINSIQWGSTVIFLIEHWFSPNVTKDGGYFLLRCTVWQCVTGG